MNSLLLTVNRLSFAPARSWLPVVGAMVVLVLLTVYFYGKTRGGFGTRMRRFLIALRSLAFLCLALALVQPTLSFVSKETRKPKVLVLLDGSSSMNLPFEAGAGEGSTRSRSDVAADFSRALMEKLPGQFERHLFLFSDTLREVQGMPSSRSPEPAESGRDAAAGNLTGAPRSAIGTALEDAAAMLGNTPGAVVLISDGASSYGPDPSRVAGRISLPVYTVAAAVEGRFRDIEITEVLHPPSGFVGTDIPVLVRVKGYGLENLDVPISILEQGTAVARGLVRLAGSTQTEVLLSVTPKKGGVHFYQVSVPLVKGEASTLNNTTRFAVNAVSEKVRVLYLEGDFTWDFTFLKRELESDPRLEAAFALVSGWKSGLPGVEKVVSPTPGELARSSVVVVGDGAAKYLSSAVWRALEGFVAGGGGLLLAGPDGLSETPAFVRDMLPAQLSRPEKTRHRGFVNATITVEGLSHSVCEVEKDPLMNQQSWREVSPLMGTQALGRPRPGATVLLEGTLDDDDERFPVVVAGEYGRGRVLLVGAEGFWRWGFTLPGAGGSKRLLASFASNAVSWLSESSARSRVDVSPSKWVFESGDNVTFTARGIEDPAQLSLDIKDKTGRKAPSPVRRTGGAGVPELELGVLEPGTYTYSGSYNGQGEAQSFRGSFVVDTTGAEDRNLFPDVRLLSYISQASGGKSFDPGQVDELVSEIRTFRQKVVVERQLRLWNHPVLFVLFTFFLTLEWWLRRRSGLP